MKFLSVLIALATPCLAMAGKPKHSPWLKGHHKILTTITHLPREVKAYLTFHEHFLEGSKNHHSLDYCVFDTTGRGAKTNDLDTLLSVLTLDLTAAYIKDQVLHENEERAKYAKSTSLKEMGPEEMIWVADHSYIMPINGTKKYFYMSTRNDWKIQEACVDACTTCAQAAITFKSHWMFCNRVATRERSAGMKSPAALNGPPTCRIAYGHNSRSPGVNETDYYVN